MPPTALQPAEEGNKPEGDPNPAETTGGEEAEQRPTQIHSGTGQNSVALVIFFSAKCKYTFQQQCFSCMVVT